MLISSMEVLIRQPEPYKSQDGRSSSLIIVYRVVVIAEKNLLQIILLVQLVMIVLTRPEKTLLVDADKLGYVLVAVLCVVPTLRHTVRHIFSVTEISRSIKGNVARIIICVWSVEIPLMIIALDTVHVVYQEYQVVRSHIRIKQNVTVFMEQCFSEITTSV